MLMEKRWRCELVYFIIIRGPLGSGKTTISKKLSTILTAKYISIDNVLHKLDQVPPGAECIPAKNFIKAEKTLLPKIKEQLKKGKVVIIDACFYHKESIEFFLKNLPFQHYVFTLKAPIEVCIKRDKERTKTHGEDAAKAVHYLVSRFNYGTVIDVSKGGADKAVKETLKYLPKKK